VWIPWDKRTDGSLEDMHTASEPARRRWVLRPSTTDEWLIFRIYEVVASVSCCEKCGAELGQSLSLSRPSRHPSISWQVTVTTWCKSWKHHRHIAIVTDPGTDLHLGPFHRGRDQRNRDRT
jgi:hypothetical protein